MEYDLGIVPKHALDLSSRSDRRLLGRAVRENWPVREEIRPALVTDLVAEFDRWNLDQPGATMYLRAVRNTLIITRIFLAMEGLNQLDDHGLAPKPYRRWRRRQKCWHAYCRGGK